MWSRSRNGSLSRDGLYRARYFCLLSRLWEAESPPFKQILREVRQEETKSIRWIPGYAGAWHAEKIQTVNQWRKEE